MTDTKESMYVQEYCIFKMTLYDLKTKVHMLEPQERNYPSRNCIHKFEHKHAVLQQITELMKYCCNLFDNCFTET